MRATHARTGGPFSNLANATHGAASWLLDRRRRIGRVVLIASGCVLTICTLVASAVPPRVPAAARRTAQPYTRPLGSLVLAGLLPPPTLSGDRGAVGVPPGTPRPPTHARAVPGTPAIARYQGLPGTLTPAGIATLALEHGCGATEAVTASAVAMAESSGSPSAQGDVGLMTAVWDWSAGLWQIRGLRAERGTGGLRDSIANQQIEHNAASMYTISNGCTDWAPWSTYLNGDYLPFLGIAREAVRYVLAYYHAHGRYPPIAAPDPTAAIPSLRRGGAAPRASAPRATRAGRHHRPRPVRSPATGTGTATPRPVTSSSGTAAPTSAPAPRTLLPTPTVTLKLPTPTLSVPLPTLPLPTPSLP